MAAGVEVSAGQRSVNGAGTYVYGIARAAPQIRHAGVVGGDVVAIEHGSLAAIVSAVPSTDIRAKRCDLLAHQAVLQEAFASGPVVPLRFGTVFDDADAVVAELLASRHDELVRLLARFDGLAELLVRAHYLEDAVLREIVRDDPRVARLRATQSADIMLGEAVLSALVAKRAVEADKIERALVPLAQNSLLEEPRTEYELFRGAFLVEQEALASFDAKMDELARARSGTVVFKYVGPLPPQSFAGLEALGE